MMQFCLKEYTYKYRLYLNNEQKIQLNKTFGCCRFVYNNYLYESKNNEYTSKTKNNNHCNRVLKEINPFLRDVDKFALTNSIYNLDNAYKRFYNKLGREPKYKKRRSKQSYQTNYTNNNIEVFYDENLVKLPKLGKVKAKIHRKLEGQIVNATITKYPSGKYYVCILVKREIEAKEIALSVIGLDMGIKSFISDNKGNKYEPNKSLVNLEYKLTKEQQRLSNKVKGSNNYNKQRIKLARVHEKIENIRNNYLHQLSTSIINENQVIVVEDLDVASMLEVSNTNTSKKLSDVSISKFISMLEYKAKMYSKVFYKVNRYYASSQICNECGYRNKELKDLSIREYICPKCNTPHDRDINAAKNILTFGLDKIFI